MLVGVTLTFLVVVCKLLIHLDRFQMKEYDQKTLPMMYKNERNSRKKKARGGWDSSSFKTSNAQDTVQPTNSKAIITVHTDIVREDMRYSESIKVMSFDNMSSSAHNKVPKKNLKECMLMNAIVKLVGSETTSSNK